MRTLCRVVRAVALVVVLGTGLGAGLLGVAAPAASAPQDAEGGVRLSTDREYWAEDLDVALLDPDRLWIPGSSETASLWIRNTSPQRADAYAQVTFGSTDLPLADALTVRTRYDGGDWSPGATSATVPVRAGEDARLDIEVTYRPSAGNDSMSQRVPMSVRVVLAGSDGIVEPPATPDEPGTPDDEPGELPVTGVRIVRTALTAVLLVVAGAWLVVAARRRGVSHG